MSLPAPPLTSFYLYLTEGCNLSCRHCWLNPPLLTKGKHGTFLALDAIKQAVTEAKQLGLASLKLTGGEPLLHPQFVEIVELASTEALSLVVETNGTLLTGSVVEALRRHKKVDVAVSLDSFRSEVHDAFRGLRGAFDSTVAGIHKLVEAGLNPQIIATLIPENKHEIDSMIRFSQEIGAASFKLNIVQPTSRGDLMHQRGQSVPLPEILEVCQYIVERTSSETTMRIYPDIPIAFKPLSFLHGNGSGRCAVKNIMGVLASGHYALCGIGTSVKELVFGSVGVNSLREIWETDPVLKSIRRDVPESLQGICGKCMMKNACLGSCIAQNYYRMGTLLAPFWFCEAAEEMGLFPESRLLPKAIARRSSPSPDNEP